MGAPAPELSVAIVSFQCRELLLRCLESIEADASRHGYQVIVVDNASSDGTVEAVRSRFPWVELVALEDNAGFSRGNNVAFGRARGGSILLLNPDTVVPDGALPAAVRALSERPEVGMLGVKLVTEDGTLDHACKRGFPTPLGALAYFTGLSRLRPRSRVISAYTAGHIGADETSYVDAVNGAFMLVRREALALVGDLDEEYWLYMEDLDWCYRFWQAGWKVLYWPGVEVLHAKGGSSGKARAWKANRAFHRGMWLFYRKHYAANRSPVTNLGVRSAIAAKLGVSAVSSVARRPHRFGFR